MRAISFLVVFSFALEAFAVVPFELTHQGRILDSNDAPLTGTETVTFTLWEAATGTNVLWTDDLSVTFDNGYYSFALGGSANPIDENVLDNAEVWMSLTIGGEELLPRQRVVSAPYAVMAGTAENLAGGAVDASSISVDGSPVIDDTGAWVGPTVPDTLTGLTCAQDDVAAYTASGWDCLPGSTFDTVLAEDVVETFVTNGALNLAAGTQLDGQEIATGPHTVDTHAGTICRSGEYLTGDGTCAAIVVDTNAATECPDESYLNGNGTCTRVDQSGDCTTGYVCRGGHGHSEYTNASNITSGTLGISYFDAYADLSGSGRLDNNNPFDLLTREQLEGEYVTESSGDAIISGNYTHNTRTGYIYVAGSSLLPATDDAEDYIKEGTAGYVRTSGSDANYIGMANLELPQGAVVTRITGYYYDNDASGGIQSYWCQLYGRTLTSNSGVLYGSQVTDISWTPSTAVRSVDSAVLNHTVDNTARAYFLYAGLAGTNGTTNFRHYGCRITYTYTNTNK